MMVDSSFLILIMQMAGRLQRQITPSHPQRQGAQVPYPQPVVPNVGNVGNLQVFVLPPVPNGPQVSRRPGEHQLAYIPIPLPPLARPPIEARPQRRPQAKNQRHENFQGKELWSFMAMRAVKVPHSAAPLAVFLNPRSGRSLPCFIYTRSSVALHGSQTMSTHIPDGFGADDNPNIGTRHPLRVTRNPLNRDVLRDLFFVPPKSEMVPVLTIPPNLPPNSLYNPQNRLDEEVFNTRLWDAIETVIDVLMDNHCYFSGCWMKNIGADCKGDGRYVAAIAPFPQNVAGLFDEWLESFSVALVEQFKNAEGRAMIKKLMQIFLAINTEMFQNGHTTFPTLTICNNDKNTNYAFITNDIEPLKLHRLYIQGATGGSLPFNVENPPPNRPQNAPPTPHDDSVTQVARIRRMLQRDYDPACDHPIHFKCSTPTEVTYVDGGFQVEFDAVALPTSPVVQWGVVNAGARLVSSCKPFNFEVIGSKDVWGSGEECRGATYAALDALCYQNIAVVCSCTAGQAKVEYFRRTDQHVIDRMSQIFSVGGVPQPNQTASSKLGWKQFLRAMMQGYLTTVVGQRSLRELNGINMLLNNGYQFKSFGKTHGRAAFADQTVMHFRQNNVHDMSICSHIENLHELSRKSANDATPFIDY